MELGREFFSVLNPNPQRPYIATMKKKGIEVTIESNDKGEVANWISDIFIENRMGNQDRDQTETTLCKWVSKSGVVVTCNFELEK